MQKKKLCYSYKFTFFQLDNCTTLVYNIIHIFHVSQKISVHLVLWNIFSKSHQHEPLHILKTVIGTRSLKTGGGPTISLLSICSRHSQDWRMFSSSVCGTERVRSLITARKDSQKSSSSGADEVSKLHIHICQAHICFGFVEGRQTVFTLF